MRDFDLKTDSDAELYNQAAQLGKLLAQQLEAAIKAAVTRRLKRDDWQLSEVVTRMRRQRRPDGVELWLLDAKPLLEVWPPQTTKEGNKVRFSNKLKFYEFET